MDADRKCSVDVPPSSCKKKVDEVEKTKHVPIMMIYLDRVKYRCEVSEFAISDVRFQFTPFQM